MNWSNFFAMGGYALYVWGSYATALIVMGGEVILLVRRRRALAAQHGDLERAAGGDSYENKA